MTKQAEIREGIVEPICEACMPYICAHWDLPPKERLVKCKPLRNWIDRILKSESDKGVVIKVEKELPERVLLKDTNLTVLAYNALTHAGKLYVDELRGDEDKYMRAVGQKIVAQIKQVMCDYGSKAFELVAVEPLIKEVKNGDTSNKTQG